MSTTETPKYRYGQRIRIKHGFYRGRVGVVIGFFDKGSTGQELGYTVYVTRIRAPWPLWWWRTKGEFLREDELEADREQV